jgi:xanthine dehydrogenase accessory factor
VTPGDREQPWRDDETERGRVVLLTDNPISRALATIAGTVGHEVVVIAEDDGGPGLGGLGLRAGDAVVLCDHDAPDASALLREALASDASYVAMMASRRRAEGLRADLGAEGVPGLDKLHVPAGHNLGGRGPGEMALSVVAEIVAEAHDRPGGPLRDLGAS